MPGRFDGWIHKVAPTTEAATLIQSEGRKLLAYVIDTCRRMHLRQWKAEKRMPDGSVIIASFDGLNPRVQVIPAPTAAVTTPLIVSAIWLPRGFVVYPSSATSTTGWGAPVQQVGLSEFDPRNLAPRLDVGRWSPGGQLGEVLLTKQVDAGYPVSKPHVEITPAFFSKAEAPVIVIRQGNLTVAEAQKYAPPKTQPLWAAFRMEFDDFTGPDASGGDDCRVLFTNINHLHGYLLPIRGYYSAALRAARYVRSTDFTPGIPWINDHDLPAAKEGYVSATQRARKDGVPDSISHETITNAVSFDSIVANLRTEAHLADGTFTTESRVTISIAQLNGASVLDAQQRAQWIDYGVRYWISDDTAIPIISWDGFPAYNWSAAQVYGPIVAGAYQPLDYFEIPQRGGSRKMFSTRVCANGRVLGTCPDFVISVGVSTRTLAGVTVDRIIVLAWNIADQGAAGTLHADYNRKLRVFFIDVPRRHSLALAPDHAVVGLYDAHVNPDGWHYAGVLTLWADEAGFQQGLVQPPVFSGNGSRAAFVYGGFDGVVGGTGLGEVVFNTIDDGVLNVVVSQPIWSTRVANPPETPKGDGLLAADYAPGTSTIRAVYYIGVGVPVDGFVVQNCLRWSESGPIDNLPLRSNDVLISDNFREGFAFAMAYVLDPVNGALIGLDQRVIADGAPAWQVNYTIGGRATTSMRYADTSDAGSYQNDIELFASYPSVALPVYARDRDANYIAGVELTPAATFQASQFDSTLGDLAALTQTPGAGLRLYPAGAV